MRNNYSYSCKESGKGNLAYLHSQELFNSFIIILVKDKNIRRPLNTFPPVMKIRPDIPEQLIFSKTI
jgi:hypothetical protein